jgi:microsomal dipeptidase-like Zn-dependent dipeptidase
VKNEHNFFYKASRIREKLRRKKMAYIKNKLNIAIILLLAIFGISAMQISAADINGFYISDDGGAYFVRQIGNKIYWVGEKSDGSYTNVLAGKINGTKVSAKWWDVPKGKAKGGGEINLEIQNGGKIIAKISATAPFGTNKLTLAPAAVTTGGMTFSAEINAISQNRSRPEGFRVGDNNLTGVWNGDDYSTYYIREMPNGEMVWFSENNLWGDPGGLDRPSTAQVFIGKKINGLITGDWVTVPKGKAVGNNVVSLKVVNQQELKANNSTIGFDATALQRSLPSSLRGFADLHTHPMVHLSMGRKFIHGAPDVGSIIPADENCKMNYRATNIAQALGKDNSTHGGTAWFGIENRCGDNIRQAILDAFQEQNKALVTPDNALGYPSFKDYPKYNDITHQKMWVDWIRRAYHGGQRVMVALATNNETLGSAASGSGDGPTKDKESADLQIKELKDFVKRHDDFMEVALTPADLRRIVAANKMAIILGIEIDNIGNFINGKAGKEVISIPHIFDEVKRLHEQGVRYVFPVHLIDNKFGGTAIYKDVFNLSNYHINHAFWDIGCAPEDSDITKKFKVAGFDFPLAAAKSVKLNIDIARFPKDPPDCKGHANRKGLDDNYGRIMIDNLIHFGMLIDIDHSSLKTTEAIFKQAEGIPGGYPLISGHTGLRKDQHTENSRTPDQLFRIAKLGGMFGLGSEDVPANVWISQYKTAASWMKGTGNVSLLKLNEGRISFGTDLNGYVKGAPPRSGANLYTRGFLKSETGDKTWDYRKDGVAHYGMMADYLADIKTLPDGEMVYSNLMKNAEVFAKMWEKAEKNGKK